MARPDERRDADDLVEPLFAGLRDADGTEPSQKAEEFEQEIDSSPTWRRSQRLPSVAHPPLDPPEPSSFRQFVKALLLVGALVGLGAFVYFAFGV